jgi:hypothetical protein
MTLGKAATNDLPIAADPAVSRLHAVFERYPAGWCISDLGSKNGTFVDGERILGSRTLRPGDEIRVGSTRLVFRGDAPESSDGTDALEDPPRLTARERDVLIELCRPLLDGDAFTEPESARRIADHLFVSEDAVKKHLSRMYDKFGIDGDGERRRVRLANLALTRGAVRIGDLRRPG